MDFACDVVARTQGPFSKGARFAPSLGVKNEPSNPEGSFCCAAASNSSNPLFFYFLLHLTLAVLERMISSQAGRTCFQMSGRHCAQSRGLCQTPVWPGNFSTIWAVDPVRPPPLPPFATFKHAHHLRTSRLEPALLLLCLSSRYQSVIVPCPRKSTPQGLSCVESAPPLARHCNAWNGRAVTIMAALHSTRP